MVNQNLFLLCSYYASLLVQFLARVRDMDIFVDESDGEVEVCVTFTGTVSTSGTLILAASLGVNAECEEEPRGS